MQNIDPTPNLRLNQKLRVRPGNVSLNNLQAILMHTQV